MVILTKRCEAKHDGQCTRCKGAIVKGERIVWVGKGRVYHESINCPARVRVTIKPR